MAIAASARNGAASTSPVTAQTMSKSRFVIVRPPDARDPGIG
jgi:hypothetical protein